VSFLATRSPRRGSSRAASGKSGRGTKPRKAPEAALPADLDQIAARAAREIAARADRLAERVLEEYAHIAFADLRHIVEWGPDGLSIKSLKELSDDDVAAISEIVPGIELGHSRVKLYDKKAALDAIARHLGMFPLPARQRENDAPEEEEEDPREFLARELARLAAGGPEE
jgi:hypothetical protein